MDWFLCDRDLRHERVNLSLTTAPILNPLKIPENQKFSIVFRVYKMGTLARNTLIRGNNPPFSSIQLRKLCANYLDRSIQHSRIQLLPEKEKS